MLRGAEKDRHAVLAQQRHHVCLDGRRGHGGVSALAGQEIVSSADLVSQFEAVLSEAADRQPQACAASHRRDCGRGMEGDWPASAPGEQVQRPRPYRVRHGQWLERSDAPRRAGLGERAQREREREQLRLALRADGRALRAHPRRRFSAHRYLGPDEQAGQRSFTTLPGPAWWAASRSSASSRCLRRCAMRATLRLRSRERPLRGPADLRI